MRNRTADPLLAKQVLSQLSYTPISFVVIGSLFTQLPFSFTLLKNNDFKASEI